MTIISEKQRLILTFLLDFPEGKTLEEIAEHLGVTKTAAKDHVLKAMEQGYLGFTDAKGHVGRPRRHYHLTDSGHEVFPRQYAWLSNMLLELLTKQLGGIAISQLMRDLADHVSVSMRERIARLPADARQFAEITRIMNELGYRVRLKQSDRRKGAVIEASNCVYHSVAKEHPELCQFDIRFLENMSGCKVRLESCIARGGELCRFCLKESPLSPSAD